MRIENDRIVIEPADVAELSETASAALRARFGNQSADVVLTRHITRLTDIAVKDFSSVQVQKISDIAVALTADPAKAAEVLTVLNQARAILGIETKAESVEIL